MTFVNRPGYLIYAYAWPRASAQINPVAEMAIDPNRVASVIAPAVSRAISEVTRPGVTDQ